MKLTKRKGFNFFRSYYDVYNELETDKDKVKFIDALLDRQFLGIKTTYLKGMAKFAYISQTNSIESKVKGYEDKTGTKLSCFPTPPTVGVEKLVLTPTLQVQEEVQVQEKGEYTLQSKIDFDNLLNLINTHTKRNFKVINNSIQAKYKARLKDGYTKDDIKNTIINSVQDQFHKDSNYKYLTPEYFSRASTIDKFNQQIKVQSNAIHDSSPVN